MYVLEYNREEEQKAYYAIGREEGLEQGQIAMVKNFFNLGTPIDIIMKATG